MPDSFLPPAEIQGRFGSYRLLASSTKEPLGVGSTSLVYRVDRLSNDDPSNSNGVYQAAEQGRLGRATKNFSLVLKWSRDGSREPFVREAECLALLAGQGAPLLVDRSPEQSAEQFLVIEELEGESFDLFLSQRSEGLSDTKRTELGLDLLLSIGSALENLHEFGLSHGDVKTENIFYTPSGQFSLLDFGFARSVTDHTLGGGTPEYLPPEALTGESISAIERDVYALCLCTAQLYGTLERVRAERGRSISDELADILAPIFNAKAGTRPGLKWLLGIVRRRIAVRAKTNSHVDAGQDFRKVWVTEVRNAYLRERLAEFSKCQFNSKLLLEVKEPAKDWVVGYLLFFVDELAHCMHQPTDVGVSSSSQVERLAELKASRKSSVASGAETRSIESKSHHIIVRDLSLASRKRMVADLLGPFGWRMMQPHCSEEQFLLQLLSTGSAFDPTHSIQVTESGGEGFSDTELLEVSLRALGSNPDFSALSTLLSLKVRSESLTRHLLKRLRQLALFFDAQRLINQELQGDNSAPWRAELFLEQSLIRMRSGHVEELEASINLINEDELIVSRRTELAALRLRLQLQAGELDAIVESSHANEPSLLEVIGLAHLYRGEINKAESALKLGLEQTSDLEDKARLFSVRGMVLAYLGQHSKATVAYQKAAQWAEFSSAPLETATYSTNYATSESALGHLEEALMLSERAEVLFIGLGRSKHAAYALLSQAACLSQFGAAVQVQLLVMRAESMVADDWLCHAYLLLCQYDVSPSLLLWQRLRAIIDTQKVVPFELQIHLLARSLSKGLPAFQVSQGVTVTELSREAKLELLIGCCSYYCELGDDHTATSDLLRQLSLPKYTHSEVEVLHASVSLLQELESPFYRGRLAAAALKLSDAATLRETRSTKSQGERLVRSIFASQLQRARLEARSHLPVRLSGTFEQLAWVSQEFDEAPTIEPAQVIDMEGLLRVLLAKRGLKSLLEQALDLMLLWTGVDRGMILLRAPGAQLVPRVARHIKRSDLKGEQLAFSRSIAQRALADMSMVSLVEFEKSGSRAQGSIAALHLRSVLAVPLIAEGEALGVAYLDDKTRSQAFGESEKRWVNLIATVSSIALLRERENLHLRRLTGRAHRASQRSLHLFERTDHELLRVRAELSESVDSHELKSSRTRLVSHSLVMKQLLAQLQRVAKSDLTLLITGESGTGKELMARAAGEWSDRNSAAFIAENCAAIPASLLESTLFGHVKGAFTGAQVARRGIFELADQGTLFLDEVGELPLELQSKLLRVLMDGYVRPLGSEKEVKVSVRLVAATNRDLKQMVQAGTFREDLYYRLAVVPLRVPALRERREDILPLAEYFVERHRQSKDVVLSRQARIQIYHYQWPGNIRQLENEVRRACILTDGELNVTDFSPEIQAFSHVSIGDSLKEKVNELERQLVVQALELEAGNISRSALRLGLSRYGLQKMMTRLQIPRFAKGIKLGRS